MTDKKEKGAALLPPDYPQTQKTAVQMVLIRDFAGYRLTEASRQRFHTAGLSCDTWADILAIQKELPGLQAKAIISDADALVINTAVNEYEKYKPDAETIYRAFKDKEIAITRLREILRTHSDHLAEEAGENTAKAVIAAITGAADRAVKQYKMKTTITLQLLRSIDDVYSLLLLVCPAAGLWEGGRPNGKVGEMLKRGGDPFGFPTHTQLQKMAQDYKLVSLPPEKLVTDFEEPSTALLEVCNILNSRKTDMALNGQSWPKVQEPPDSYADELFKIPSITSSTARNYLAANDSVSNHLNSQTKRLQIGGPSLYLPDKKIQQKAATKTITIPAKLESEFELSRPITEYDRAVSNSVYSLLEAGNKTVTAAMIYRAMTGKAEGEYVTPAQLKLIDESMEKLATVRVTADLTAAAAARKVKINGQPIGKGQPLKRKGQPLKIRNYLLPTESVTVKVNGKTTIAYKILSTPPLYAWAKMTRQITTMPADVMDIKKVRGGRISCQSENTTETRTAVKSYLLRQLAAIYQHAEAAETAQQTNRRGKKKADKKEGPYTGSIRYDSVLRAAGVEWDGLPRQHKERYRKFIKTCLENWQHDAALSFNGFEFEEYKEGKKIAGLRITYPQC